MSKPKQITDISSFDEEVSIYKILFQDRATALLKYIIDRISVDRYENVDFRLPSILISGKEGKKLIARAFSNSLCNRFEHIQGDQLIMGGCSGSIFKNVEKETVYYISSSDGLGPSSLSRLFKFLTEGSVGFNEYRGSDYKIVSTANKLFVFSTDDPTKLCSDLCKAIDYHCFLRNYNTSELEILLGQRLRWCGVGFEEQIPAIIVRNGEGSMSKCIRLLSICFLVMRGNCRANMLIQDIETGIGLNSSQELVPAPPADTIPY